MMLWFNLFHYFKSACFNSSSGVVTTFCSTDVLSERKIHRERTGNTSAETLDCEANFLEADIPRLAKTANGRACSLSSTVSFYHIENISKVGTELRGSGTELVGLWTQ